LDAAMRERLVGHDWPGNVRELENVIESLVALSPPDRLDLALLPGSAAAPGTRAGLKERLEAYERGLIAQAITEAHGDRSEAARLLGIGRATLYEKLKKLGIDPRE
ncbi:MAG: sigma-54-dependent Fis family transcriptional regulator, partial [Sandaracinaceae bacterium]|nr:sigma-54-dependent Fis family transcriptional regulator [Sandaracinaceae bacterium]